MDIVKNPIIIAVVAGVAVYVYLSWKSNNKKKHKKKEPVNLLIPLAVAIIAWFMAYAYFGYGLTSSQPSDPLLKLNDGLSNKIQLPMPMTVAPSFKFVGDVVSSSEPRSFSLLTNGITVPDRLPDVLMEVYDK